MLTTPPHDIQKDYQRLLDYRADPAYAQSDLKVFIGKKKPKDDEAYLRTGNLIDTLVMTPWHFDNVFYISDNEYDDFILRLSRWIIDTINTNEDYRVQWLQDEDPVILDAYLAIDYQTRWKPDTKLKHKDAIITCINELILSEGKAILKKDEVTQAKIISERAVTFIKNYYSGYLEKGWTIEVQTDYRFKYRKYDCKSLLDFTLMSPDRQNLEIIPIDFKTTGLPMRHYHTQCQKLRYDFQAAFYTEALSTVFPSAFVHNFQLVVYSFADDNFEVMTLSDQDLSVGKHGMTTQTTCASGTTTVVRTYRHYGFDDAFRLKDLSGSEIRQLESTNGNAIWI